jgi:hypothetical protein
VTPVATYVMAPAASSVLPGANFCTAPRLRSDDLVLLREHLRRRWASRAGRWKRLSAHGAG